MILRMNFGDVGKMEKVSLLCTVDAGYKNTLGSRKICSYNGINYTVDMKTVFQKMVLYPECSYNQVFS